MKWQSGVENVNLVLFFPIKNKENKKEERDFFNLFPIFLKLKVIFGFGYDIQHPI